jgi:RNA polymerase sigma-70 factor (ECF subfamily)
MANPLGIGRRSAMNNNSAGGPESWVDRHGDSLFRYAMFRLREPDLAADVVQETFLDALRARRSFEGRSHERTWLIGILKHKIADHHRKNRRDQSVLNGASAIPVRDANPSFDGRGHWRNGPGSWAGDPGRDLESREFWETFTTCLAKLPQGLADAFYLRELDDLSAEEVRDLLGITPANLWARLHRARSFLRKCLELNWFGHRNHSTPHHVNGRCPQ